MDLFELTRKLISIPSLSGKENKLADFLCGYFHSIGLPYEEQIIKGNRRNLWVFPSKNQKIILCTHLDTVSPFIPPSEDPDYIYGRGACDAKGIMASMIQAVCGLRGEGLSGFGLLLTAGEEADSDGAKKACESGKHSRYIVVGEPTGNRMGKSHWGFLSLKLTAKGKAAHSAFPNRGDSAVLKLMESLNLLRSWYEETGGKDEFLMNIALIEGGTAPNIIPGRAESTVTFRTRISPRILLEKIKNVILPDIETDVKNQSEPQNLFTLPGFKQAVLTYGTDIPYLKNFGKPLLFGPGSGEDAHTEKEKIKKQDLADSVSYYKKIIKLLMNMK